MNDLVLQQGITVLVVLRICSKEVIYKTRRNRIITALAPTSLLSSHFCNILALKLFVFERPPMHCEKNRNSNAKLVRGENVKTHNYCALINYRLLLFI